MNSMQRLILALVAAALLLGGFVAAVVTYNAQRAEQLASIGNEGESSGAVDNAFERVYSWSSGSPDAKVTVVEFFDPGCESCAAVAPHVKALLDAHPGRVRLVMRYIPLHQGADTAVKMLEAARKQGKFRETMQLMFDAQPQWASHHHPAPEVLMTLLPSLGLDMARLERDMQGIDVGHVLQQDIADAQTLGVRSTPTFFVNGKPLPRFGLRELQQLVASEVRAAYGG